MNDISDLKTITTKSTNLLWFNCITLSSIIFFLVVAFSLVNDGKSPQVVFLIATILSAASIPLSHYLAKSQIDLSINNQEVIISEFTLLTKDIKTLTISNQNVYGFEIAKSKQFTYLIIYENNLDYYKYRIKNTYEELEIKSLLSVFFKELNKNNNPNYKTFWKAFWFVIFKVFLCSLITSLTFLAIILTKYEVLYHKLPIFCVVLLPIMAFALCWWLFIYKPIRKKQFRYFGFSPINSLFLLISIILIIPIWFNIQNLRTKPVTINQTERLLNYPKTKLFYISDIHYKLNDVLLYTYKIGTYSSKSFKRPVYHLFTTPITLEDSTNTTKSFNFWLGVEYTQRINKFSNKDKRADLIRDFGQQSKSKFITAFQKKPTFYEILYSDLNSKFDDKDAYHLVKSSFYAKTPTIILEPHWESMNTYRKNLLQAIFWCAVGIMVFNIFSAIIISNNR